MVSVTECLSPVSHFALYLFWALSLRREEDMGGYVEGEVSYLRCLKVVAEELQI